MAGRTRAAAKTPQAESKPEPEPEAAKADQSAPADAQPATVVADQSAPADTAAAAPQDGAIPPDDLKPEQKPGVDVGATDTESGYADSDPEPVSGGEMTVIVAIEIGGTRNGEPWPAVGEPITLPAAEAAGYLQFGYVRASDAE